MSKKQNSGATHGKRPPGEARRPYGTDLPDGVLAPTDTGSQQREAAEPSEVLGRHRNSGQKDHKGAR